MKRSSRWFTAVAAVHFFSGGNGESYALAGGKHTFTGEVGDAMCGRKHMEGAKPQAACTRACVAHGSQIRPGCGRPDFYYA